MPDNDLSRPLHQDSLRLYLNRLKLDFEVCRSDAGEDIEDLGRNDLGSVEGEAA